MFQAHSILKNTYHPLQVLAVLSFSVIISYSAIEIVLCCKLSKQLLGNHFQEKTLACLLQASLLAAGFFS